MDVTALQTPIVLAPMAGGFNTPELAAAVANSGGVGSFGFAYSSPEAIDRSLLSARQLTAGHLNANFFIFSDVTEPEADTFQRAIAAITGLVQPKAFDAQVPARPFFPDLEAQLEPVWAHRPAVLTFHFGLPSKAVLERAHELGIRVGVTATCVSEALSVQAAGADFIVAQGWEAGGHRGCFDPELADDALDTKTLTAKLAQSVDLPIVAAGGLMTGSDIAGVLEAGACAAQLGTAFLTCPEAGTPDLHRQFMLQAKNRETGFTQAFSGRPARGIQNAFMREMENKPRLPFPLQNTLTGGLRRWAGDTGNYEYQSVWAGTGLTKLRSMPASGLVALLMQECSASAMKGGG